MTEQQRRERVAWEMLLIASIDTYIATEDLVDVLEYCRMQGHIPSALAAHRAIGAARR